MSVFLVTLTTCVSGSQIAMKCDGERIRLLDTWAISPSTPTETTNTSHVSSRNRPTWNSVSMLPEAKPGIRITPIRSVEENTGRGVQGEV